MGDLTQTEEQKQSLSPALMIQQAVERGADLSQFRELLSLQKEWESNEAKKHFFSSFPNAQAEIESIIRTKNNVQTHSKYATLENIIEQVKPIYTKFGFAVIFYEGTTEKLDHIRICADVIHDKGHKETYYFDVPLDGVGLKGNANMSKIHAKASSSTYGRRYLMCMIWNIPTADDDGNKSYSEVIDDKQLNVLRDLLIDAGLKESPLCKFFEIDSLEELKKDKFNQAVTAIKTQKDQKAKK